MSASVVPLRHIQQESIVTGEAVALEISPASPLLRAAATMVDIALTLFYTVIALYVAQLYVEVSSESMLRVVAIGTLVMLLVILPMTVEVATRGRSLGKWAFGLQVVRDDGGVITARHSLMRMLAGILEVWLSLGAIAMVTTLVAPRSKRLGDMAAGTMVIRLPEPQLYAPVLMPPDLAEWASTAQVVSLPTSVSSQALHFLRTSRSLVPHVREAGAQQIAQQLMTFVEPAPPANTHPERFIAAVLVVRRDRDLLRLVARDERSQRSFERATTSPFGL
ncbi:RDD family protein [Schaalia sp. Marseille-Q2122]|uniref:RDD family protein n=1 Tax=Schaalia sp. Marseille-Q2122 TaxID=2736604 RepID=UPI001588A5A7|nr:RDD family protein [Schaalia sp. Marseille-Q2122]